MGASPLISVLIPCYNVSDYVEKAVHSILSQSHKNLEIWVIDDGSTDDTLHKINAIKDERIKVIAFKENTKKIPAVNEVLQKVNGHYIAFQDADDWSDSARLQVQLREFNNDAELGICFTGSRYIGDKTILPAKICLTDDELKNEFLNFFKSDATMSPTVCGTMMISRAALQKTNGYNSYFTGRIAEDIQWVYRILKDFKGITVDETLYNYRLRKGSLTQIQSTGINPKYAYSWQLLSKIIHKDIYEGTDLLAPGNKELLNKTELEACEEALAQSIQLLNETRSLYENSTTFKLGRLLLKPFQIFRNMTTKAVKKA